MNVKKKLSDSQNKYNKENIETNLGASPKFDIIIGKGNMGEQIRKKTKINFGIANIQSIPIHHKKESNIFYQSRNGEKLRNRAMDRLNMQKKSSIQISDSSQTSRSIKSVRFSDKGTEETLPRKHSSTSILKNTKFQSQPRSSINASMKNSICSNIQKNDQSTDNSGSNKILKEKYEKLVDQLKKTNRKFTDELFPQTATSLSIFKDSNYKQLKWMRLCQLYQGKYLTVWDPNEPVKVNTGAYSKNTVFSTCLNSIKSNNFLIEKMFQNQSFNQYGIYFVKINQNSSWKYIIVDDYIPVYKENKKFVPAFIQSHCPNPNHMQLWPFLLQKAYAKYYSNYECLIVGNQLQLLQQFTGCYPLQLDPSSDADFEKITEEMKNLDTALIGKDDKQKYYPIVPRKQNFNYELPEKRYAQNMATQLQFRQKFKRVYCIFLHKYFYSGFCTIKFSSQKVESADHISLRTFKVEESTQCSLTIAQKDKKHLYMNDYKYSWIRMIVLMKESGDNYRWIKGVYRNSKFNNLHLKLQPGEYYVFIMPEWRGKGYDLDFIFQGNTKVNIERKSYIGSENILIEAAMDLAQSKGKLKQLNQNICTYTYIDKDIGFIIENINNERPHGSVRILRSIEGLQKSYPNMIRAFNPQFKQQQTIQFKIPSLQHYTVVLGVQGGVNKLFLDQFDFGN